MTRVLERERAVPFVIKKSDIEGDALWVCGCGLSLRQPFCDGSHKLARGEPPGEVVRYERRDGVLVRLPAGPPGAAAPP